MDRGFGKKHHQSFESAPSGDFLSQERLRTSTLTARHSCSTVAARTARCFDVVASGRSRYAGEIHVSVFRINDVPMFELVISNL